VAVYIRSLIEVLDSETRLCQDQDLEDVEPKMKTTAEAMTLPVSVGNIYLGAPQKPSSIQLIHDQHEEDPAFRNFHLGLVRFLSAELGNVSSQVLPSTRVCMYSLMLS
jgi:hypothetical protein